MQNDIGGRFLRHCFAIVCFKLVAPGKPKLERTMPMLVLSVICLIAYLVPEVLQAQEARPRSMLVLDQSETRGPFYYDIFSALRSTVIAHLD